MQVMDKRSTFQLNRTAILKTGLQNAHQKHSKNVSINNQLKRQSLKKVPLHPLIHTKA